MSDDNKPYINEHGDLVIPFACANHEFKFWKQEGLPMDELLSKLDAPREVWELYSYRAYPEDGETSREDDS